MSLPVYFVQPPGLSPPSGRLCLCGWSVARDGSLKTPIEAQTAEALVFDDRRSLPPQFSPLLEEILSAKSEIGAKLIVLDFEREPTAASLSFVRALSKECRVAAPEPYCKGNEAEPIFCYCPAKETFAQFSRRIRAANAWLELRPVDEEITYPLPGMQPKGPSPEFFSDILQCCYKAECSAEGFKLHLYDTADSLRRRAAALAPNLKAAIGLHNELLDHGFGSMIDFTDEIL